MIRTLKAKTTAESLRRRETSQLVCVIDLLLRQSASLCPRRAAGFELPLLLLPARGVFFLFPCVIPSNTAMTIPLVY